MVRVGCPVFIVHHWGPWDGMEECQGQETRCCRCLDPFHVLHSSSFIYTLPSSGFFGASISMSPFKRYDFCFVFLFPASLGDNLFDAISLYYFVHINRRCV